MRGVNFIPRQFENTSKNAILYFRGVNQCPFYNEETAASSAK